MIATLIIALLSFTLYRFVVANLNALRASTELSEERDSLQAVMRLLQSQLAEIPPRTQGALLGQAHKFKELPSDEMKWMCRAGEGLMTTAAAGEYRVTFTVQPVESQSAELELGLRREPVDADARSDADFFTRGTGINKYSWLSLIRPVAALEIRYYDPRVNSWLDRWTDLVARPSLVRVRLWRTVDDDPVEQILSVPSARVTQ